MTTDLLQNGDNNRQWQRDTAQPILKYNENCKKFGGAKGGRTPDLLHAMQALSQLSYGPIWRR